jgi:hypothetical protein
MSTRADRIFWEMGRPEQVGSPDSKEGLEFQPFWMEFTGTALSYLNSYFRNGRKVLSPELVIFHPAQRELRDGISKVLNLLSEQDIDTYGRLRTVPSLATSSIGADSPEIPCLTFFIAGSEEETAVAKSRRLVEDGAHAFTDAGLALPTEGLPQILEAALELQGLPPIA